MRTKSISIQKLKGFSKVLILPFLLFGLNFKSASQCNANFSEGTSGFDYTHHFKNLSTGSIYKTYVWDFGDGTTSTLTNPSHTYTNPNPVKVCLYLTDTSTNCKDTFCQMVYNCDSRFAYMVTDKTVEIFHSAPGLRSGDRFDFGDGFTYTEYPKITHTYSKPGVYIICHTKYCSSTEKTETCYMVNLGCEADFNYKAEPSDSLKFIFTNQSKGHAATYLWSFGEKNYFNTETNPTYKYKKAGYYNVGLRLEENNNSTCRDSVFKTIIIGTPPCDTTVYVRPDINKAITFGSQYNHQNLKFDFGDGKFYFGQQGRYRYKSSGTYTVKISYVCYNQDTINLFRTIYVPPSDSCAYLTLNLNVSQFSCADSIGLGWANAQNGLAPYAYVWYTDPPIKGQNANISKAGVYEVKVTDANKCSRTRKIAFYGFDVNKVSDVRTNLSSSVIRPGRHGSFTIEAINDGCVTAKGRLFLVLDKLLIYEWAKPLPNKIVGDTLFWNYKDLVEIEAEVYFKTKTTATIKDTVNITISASKDEFETNLENNTKKYRFNIVNSYDPNIKSVFPYGECTDRYVEKNKPLTYTIQFQNTGNAPAIDVAILDEISDKMFDLNTLRIVSQSHPNLIVEVLDSTKVKFRHDNIYLPDSFSNERGSHGYITYEISPKQALPNRTKVGGKADIYFDFNAPVSTNSVINTLIDKVPACAQKVSISKEYEKNELKFYPNPTNDILNLEIVNQNQVSHDISIINLLGVSVFQQTSYDSKLSLNIGFLPSGIYLILVKGDGKVVSGKFVKQ